MGLWKCNYGQLVGISHGNKIPCQDYAYAIVKNGVTISVLSDGCGSSPLSQYGSKATCDAIVKLFTNNFDKIIKLSPFELRKKVIDSIIDSLNETVKDNYSVFEQYKKNDLNAESIIKKTSIENYYLRLTYATVLFVASKYGVAYVGQIGDGVIGIIEDDKLKIYCEEEKTDEVNATCYPANIYNFAKQNQDWYKSNLFRLNRIKIRNVSGFILTSDGVDALFDRRIKGKCKYSNGSVKLINKIIKNNNFHKSQKYLEKLLVKIVGKSTHFDDCSVSVILKKGSKINGLIVKDYFKNTNDFIEPIHLKNKTVHNLRCEYKKVKPRTIYNLRSKIAKHKPIHNSRYSKNRVNLRTSHSNIRKKNNKY